MLDSREDDKPKAGQPEEQKDWVKEGMEESRREKKKVFGFQKKIKGGMDFRKKPSLVGKFTHGTRGKPTHGPRGNQG